MCEGLSKIAVDKTAGLVTVGSGATLYSIYQALAAEGLAIPAGSCPTVGISGHLTGGGFGLLGRAYGLTCDHLRQLTLIDSQARPLQASATSNPDLFWGCRGGGGGSFGVATEFTLSAVPLKSAVVFGVSWALPQSAAARVFQAWQSWAPNAPKDVTSIMKVGPAGNGRISMRCIGQSIGSESEVRNQLRTLVQVEPPSKPVDGADAGLSGRCAAFRRPPRLRVRLHESQVRLRGERAQLSRDRRHDVRRCSRSCGRDCAPLRRLWRRSRRRRCRRHGLSAPPWLPLLHSILRELVERRRNPRAFGEVAGVYNAMRPYMVGASYVNYCDLDLRNWASAYWGPNLDRLMAVKTQYDPANLFHHAQSVPPGPPVA